MDWIAGRAVVMGIVRRGCPKSIAWHESSWRIDAFQALPGADPMRGNSPARGRVATGKSIGDSQDEAVREWHEHPQEKPAATAG